MGIHPVAPEVRFEAIDPQLKKNHQWLCWKYIQKKGGKWAKVPFQANGKPASTVDPANWASYDDALDAYLYGDQKFSGIGYVFAEDDGVVGIDIDDCIDNDGHWSDLALEAVDRIPGYCEVTPSGNGIHIITQGEIPRAFKDDSIGLEVYTKGRYFTVTGHTINGHNTIAPGDLDWLINKHFDTPETSRRPPGDLSNALPIHFKHAVDLSDQQIERTLSFIDPDAGYDRWLSVGQALHHQYQGSDQGLGIWDEWSKRSVDYDPQEIEHKWPSFSNDLSRNPITFASVIKWAKVARVEIKRAVQEKQSEGLIAGQLPDLDFMQLPRREWVLGHRLLARYITATFAPGGVSKSTFSMVTASAIATGQDLTGEGVHKSGPVWIINNEDDHTELMRRLAGICLQFNIQWSDLQKNLFITSGYGSPYVVSTHNDDGSVAAHPNAGKIIEQINARGVVHLVVDPFISTHESDENDNNAIQHVVDSFKHIAAETGVSIEIIHHTRKGGGDSETHAGNVEAGRGASSLKDACRVAVTLAKMGAESAEENGVDAELQRRLVRLDQGKGNFALPDDEVSWFKLESVSIGNGDQVGVPVPFDLSAVRAEHMAQQRALDEATLSQWRVDIAQAMPENRVHLRQDLVPRLIGTWSLSDSRTRMRVHDAVPFERENGVEVEGVDARYLVWQEKDREARGHPGFVLREAIGGSNESNT